jgi:RsiW-degrading membrane proteinase PrsW (M82 family)
VSSLSVLLQLVAVVLPLVLFAAYARRPRADDGAPGSPPRGRRLALAAATTLLGAALFVPAWLLQRRIEGWAGLDEHARTSTDLTALVYALLVAAPLEQGLKVAAVVPAWRSRYFVAQRDGVLFGAAAALGFISAHNVELFLDPSATALDVGRGMLAAPAHVFFAAAWGWALGREAKESPQRRFGGRVFNVTWLVAMLFNGVYDHLVFARSGAALLAVTPLVLVMAVVAIYARRSLDAGEPATRRPRRLSIAPPSLSAVRAALWRTERPVMVGWIGVGALVTIGVITAAIVSAVALGRRVGVDFAAVDRGDGSSAAAAPLILLGAAALAAFPVAGWLVARASSSRSVLESAIAAALAIAGALVLLGLAAPVAVVFAIAFAPIALGLSCLGAWVGIKD